MNQDFILSRKLLYATAFGVIVIGGALYISYSNTKTPASNQQETTDNTQQISTLEQRPAPSPIPAPNAVQDSDSTPQEDLTETDILTRNLLGPYIDRVNNESYTKEIGDNIIQNATDEMFTLYYNPIKASDIITFDNASTSAISQYKRDLYVVTKPLFDIKEYELTTYARATDSNSKEDFDSLLTTAKAYTKSGNDAAALAAPIDIADVHLDIINSLYKFSAVLEALSKGYDDPAASLAGTGNFSKAEEELQQAFSKLKTYFILNDVDNITL